MLALFEAVGFIFDFVADDFFDQVFDGDDADNLIVSFDREMAISLGKNVVAWDLCLYLIIGLAIAFGVMTVGPLLVFGLLVVPPLAARQITRGMWAFSIVSSLIGGASALIGFYLSLRWDLPLGPTDVAVACGVLTVISAVHATVRWLRQA